MKLKRYQSDTLSTLRRFLETARVAGPAGAYKDMIAEPELAARLKGHASPYRPLSDLPGVPYVCLRLPTGGGKTVLAAHAIGIARDAGLEKDYPLVLWLVPSNTIRQQTADALKNPRHPYRQALDEAFGGRVRVFDIADFTLLRPQDLRDACCVVVGTIQSLRVSNTEGRKVYAHHEDLEPHFTGLAHRPAGLETLPDGTVKFSFANLMHIQRPLMIVDEAHNAVTGLTREMQARVNPAAIIEFSATPRANSNILYSVTAQELKAEDMIKLPILLSEHDTWQNAVSGALSARADLAKIAGTDPDYIRPIVLFQAQPKDQEVTVEVLRTYLIESENIPADQIAVATGDQRELDGINLFDPRTKIEYIITVEALKEGWDCSFAYVFCSVARIQSAVNVEQLLGRVLRMPYARRRPSPELNRAYAHVSEARFGDAARALVDRLVEMGFDEEEAADAIQPAPQQGNLDWGEESLFGARPAAPVVFRHVVTAAPELARSLAVHPGVAVRAVPGGRLEVAITGWVAPELERTIAAALPATAAPGFREAVTRYRADVKAVLPPAERGEVLRVPRLMAEVQGQFEFADSDTFLYAADWSLQDHSARLSETDFAIRDLANTFEIDLDGTRISYQFASEDTQLALDIPAEGWTAEALVQFLLRENRHDNLHPRELTRWLSDLVQHLLVTRGLALAALMRCKFILGRAVRSRLEAILKQERERAFQHCLFAPDARVETSFETGFTFRAGVYQGQKLYRGKWKAKKHFLGPARIPAFDGADDGEEVQCAQALDSLPEVKFWLRNVARDRESFCLPTATDYFYPDFIAELEDGRLLVIEYKGAHLADGADTAEKRAIGHLWEKAGGGLFLVVEKLVGGRDMRAQMQARIRA